MRAASTLKVVALLKLKLTLRHYQKNWGNAAVVVGGLLLVIVLVLGGGFALSLFISEYGTAARDTAFIWAAWILSIFWLIAPLLQFDAQRNLDLNGLRLLPMSGTAFTLAVLLDAVISPLGLIIAPVLIACVAVLSLSAAEAPFVLLSFALLMVCLLGLGQAIYLWANRFLASRRFADISLVIGLVFFLAIQGLNLLLHTEKGPAVPAWADAGFSALREMLSPTLEWLFPGLAARGVAAISQGNGGEALGLYLLLSVQAAACIWLAGLAARQFYEGELESGGSAKPVRVPAAQRPRLSLIGPLLGALFHRERVYLIRDPMLKMLLIQTVATMLYVMAMVAFLGFRGAAEGNPFLEELRSYAVLFAGLLLGGLESGTLFNKFGYEGFMLTHVLITPADRGQLLAAKSIFYLSHFATINAVLVIGLGIVLQAPPIFTAAAVLMVLANTAIIDVVGHFVSIYYPFTYRRRGRRMRAVMAQPGCGYVFVYTMVWQACNLAVLPGSAAIALGAIFGGIGGLFLGALIAGSLVFIAYRYGLPYAARLLLAREPELLAVLSKSAD